MYHTADRGPAREQLKSRGRSLTVDRLCKSVEDRYILDEMSEACPYIPGNTSRMRFLDGRRVGMTYRKLMDQGYRRTGAFVYRPVCEACQACEVLRVPVAEFKRS